MGVECDCGLTNEPESTLAKESNVDDFCGSLPDEIVAVQSYTGSVAAVLLLAGQRWRSSLDVRGEMPIACRGPLMTALIRAVAGAGGGMGFVCIQAGAAIYFLGRGDSVCVGAGGGVVDWGDGEGSGDWDGGGEFSAWAGGDCG